MHYICYCTVDHHACFLILLSQCLQIFVIIVYVSLYGKLHLALSGLESAIMKQARMRGNRAFQAAMGSQSIVYGDWTRKRFQKHPRGFYNHAASALFSVLHFLPWDKVTLFWQHNSP